MEDEFAGVRVAQIFGQGDLLPLRGATAVRRVSRIDTVGLIRPRGVFRGGCGVVEERIRAVSVLGMKGYADVHQECDVLAIESMWF